MGVSGLVLAQTVPLPDGFAGWPVTAMMAFITLSAIALLSFFVNKLFKTLDNLGKLHESITELCARMNTRPCLKDE
jgi:hypothetical protein